MGIVKSVNQPPHSLEGISILGRWRAEVICIYGLGLLENFAVHATNLLRRENIFLKETPKK